MLITDAVTGEAGSDGFLLVIGRAPHRPWGEPDQRHLRPLTGVNVAPMNDLDEIAKIAVHAQKKRAFKRSLKVALPSTMIHSYPRPRLLRAGVMTQGPDGAVPDPAGHCDQDRGTLPAGCRPKLARRRGSARFTGPPPKGRSFRGRPAKSSVPQTAARGSRHFPNNDWHKLPDFRTASSRAEAIKKNLR